MSHLTRRQFTRIAALTPFALGAMLNRSRADIGKVGGGRHELTILNTNDFHSAFEPILGDDAIVLGKVVAVLRAV